MTSQALLLNKNEVIMVSDLAITTPDGKSYSSGEKIFELSKEFPIAMMINGCIDFEDIALSTLIGEFKQITDFKSFKTIENVKNEFLKYLSTHTQHTKTDDYLKWILRSFKQDMIDDINEYGFKEALGYCSQKPIPDFIKNYENFNEEFHDIIPPGENKEEYNLKLWKIFSKYLTYEGTGLIFAVFDEKHYYPSYFEVNIYCNDNEQVIYEEIGSQINCKNPKIMVFAVNEEAYAFLTGVSTEFEEFIIDYINIRNDKFLNLLEKGLIKNGIDFKNADEIMNICKSIFENWEEDLNPIINSFKSNSLEDTSISTEYLPSAILYELGDYLIKLTALKQKLSSEIETVSSETRIASIRKFDNFKWINNNV